MLTHDNAWSNLRATVAAFRSDTSVTALAGEDKPPNLIANPLSHTAGVVRVMSRALRRPADPPDAQVRRPHRQTSGRPARDRQPPAQPYDAADPPRRTRTWRGPRSRPRYVSSGTAPLPRPLRAEFEKRFDVPVLQAYGQTEAFGGLAVESVKDVLTGRRRPGSVGRALPGVELRIVTADGSTAGPGEPGEIRARTRSVTAGYLGAEPGASPLDDEGWCAPATSDTSTRTATSTSQGGFGTRSSAAAST